MNILWKNNIVFYQILLLPRAMSDDGGVSLYLKLNLRGTEEMK